MAKKNISVYLSFLLRHRPETILLAMDKHGWVLVEDLIEGVNKGINWIWESWKPS